MYLRLEAKHEEVLKRLGVLYKNYDKLLYVNIDDLKHQYDKLEEEMNISSLIRFDNLVFSTDFEIIRAVS